MAYIRTHSLPHSKNRYYTEVTAFRDDNGKVRQKERYLGKELPKDLGYIVGYRQAKLTVGKRIQVFNVKLGMEDFLDQVGVIKELRKKYALIIFDQLIRKRRDWLLPFDMIGNIRKRRTTE